MPAFLARSAFKATALHHHVITPYGTGNGQARRAPAPKGPWPPGVVSPVPPAGNAVPESPQSLSISGLRLVTPRSESLGSLSLGFAGRRNSVISGTRQACMPSLS